MNAYENSWAHLSEELRRLDLLLHIQVLQSRKQHQKQEHEFTAITSPSLEEFKGLVLPEGEIDNLLSQSLNESEDHNPSGPDIPAIQGLVDQMKKMEAQIQEKRDASPAQGVYLSLPHLSYLFQLTSFEEQILLLCLAPELDRKYEQLYAYLQNDITKKKPSVDFVLSLLCGSSEEKIAARRVFSLDAPLVKYQLLQFNSESSEQMVPLLSRSLKLDNRILNFILGFVHWDGKINSFAQLIQPQTTLRQAQGDVWEEVQTPEDLKGRLRSLTQWYFQQPREARDSKKLICLFQGDYGTGKKEVAEAICRELGIQLVIADVGGMLNGRIPFEEAVWLLFRESLLLPAAIYLEGFERLIEAEQHRAYLSALVPK